MTSLHESLAYVARHGYLLLFGWVAAEQLGLPVPAVPILIAAGVLSSTGQIGLVASILLAIVACLIGDIAWYAIGKVRGTAVLQTLCRMSIEPESCVQRSSNFIARHGGRSLVIAKFIPGISTVAVPLAANSGVSLPAFFFYDFLGSLLYVGSYIVAGHLLGDRIDRLAALTDSLRTLSIWFAAIAATSIVVWRILQRRKFHSDLRMARIAADELLALIEGGAKPYIVDLRHPLDVLPDPRVIPGALRMSPDELAERHGEIPRDREIILYCT